MGGRLSGCRGGAAGGREEFVRSQTRARRTALVPELVIRLAEEPIALWERTEARLDEPSEPPFWGFAWAGGQALARYLLDVPATVAGRRVLDIASGSGLVAVAAALAGASSVTATDVDPLAVAAVHLNATANGVVVEVLADDVLDGDGMPADVVLVGDAFYERTLAARVVPFLERASARGATVLVGDLGRTFLPRDRLRAVCAYEVRGVASVEDADTKTATVWTFPDAPPAP